MAVEPTETPHDARRARSITRAAAIINPISGAGLDRDAVARRISLVRDAFARAGVAGPIQLTERIGHARELAAAAVRDRADLLVVWGGDGTANEAGAALINTPTAFGLVPAGSGNGLAAALGSPRDPAGALERILSSPPRAIDVGVIGERPFFNIAGIGFDAHVAACFNRRGAGRRGRWPYVAIGVREGCRYRGRHYSIELDSATTSHHALLIAFANGREYGMGACISRCAALDDGLLDVTIIEDRAVLARFWHVRHLASGYVERAPGVRVERIRRAVVTSEQPMHYHADGEPDVAGHRLEIRVLPGALTVRG
jgi:diacylglycerol kinase (ATP)